MCFVNAKCTHQNVKISFEVKIKEKRLSRTNFCNSIKIQDQLKYFENVEVEHSKTTSK